MSAQETPPVDELFADLDLPDIDAEVFADADEPAREDRWRIDSPEKAEWAMAKLSEARARVAELTEQRNAQMERAQAWWTRVVKDPQRTAGYMQAQLVEYALAERDAGHGATVILANGEIPTRKGPEPCVDIDDETAVLEWAIKNRPEIVTVKRSVKLTDLRTVVKVVANVKAPDRLVAVTVDGEVVPGTFVREAGDPYVPDVKPY